MEIAKKLAAALLIGALSLPSNALAVRIKDGSKNLKYLTEKTLITENDIKKYGISGYGKGFQANFHDHGQLVDILTKIYGSDIIDEESKNNPQNPHQDGLGYFIFGEWKKTDNGRQLTIFDSFDRLNREDSWTFGSQTKIYSTLEEVLGSDSFRKMCNKYGAEKMFIQSINLLEGTNEGLYNSSGNLVVDRNNKKAN